MAFGYGASLASFPDSRARAFQPIRRLALLKQGSKLLLTSIISIVVPHCTVVMHVVTVECVDKLIRKNNMLCPNNGQN